VNWKAFGKGVFVAAIGGAFTGTTSALQDGNVSGKRVASLAMAGAILAVAAYLKQSPLPPKPQSDPPPDPGPQG